MWKISCLLLLVLTSSANWSPLDDLIREAISEHVFPGASITVANDKQILFRGNYGHLTYKHDLNEIPVSNTTKYDVASITKVMATTLNLMNMFSSNSIQLTDLVSKYI
jgi:CubicO group peptidase (beta-lactamase class C family)